MGLKADIHSFVKLPDLVAAVLKDSAEPALKDLIAKSATKVDDAVFAIIAPFLPGLELALIAKFQSTWDSLLSEDPKSVPPLAPAAPDGPVI